MQNILCRGADSVDAKMKSRLLGGTQMRGGIQNSAVFITEHQPLRRNSTQRDIASRDQHMSAAPGADVSASSADQSVLIDQFGVGDQIFYLIGVRFLPAHWTSSQRHIIFSRTGTLPMLPPFRANSLPVRAPSRILP